MILSDQTLSERLFARFRELRMFELFARKLGPGQPVRMMARWFDRAGNLCTTHGTAPDAVTALVELLDAIEREMDTPAPPAPPRIERRIERRTESERVEYDPEQQRRRGGPEHRRRVALEIAERRGAVTATLLYHSMGGGGAMTGGNGAREARDYVAACESTLAELADEGLLRRGTCAYELAREEQPA